MIIRNDFNPAECDYIKTNSPITNADRIRIMTDEELNNWITCPKELGERTIGNCMTNGCYKCKEDWLKQESK